MSRHRRAKIVATIGPATQSAPQLQALIGAGMDVARFNFSHGDPDENIAAIQRLRTVADEMGRPVGVLQDLQGPRLRTGTLENGKPVQLQDGSAFTLNIQSVSGNADQVCVSYPHLTKDVKPGDTILLDNGRIELQVTKLEGDLVHTKVIDGGELGEEVGLNLPGVRLTAPPLTEKDSRDLELGLQLPVDMVAMSFVRSADDVHQLRSAMGDRQVPIIAKLERPEAVQALDEILEAADGVMVARGDLGVEVSPERVPSIQKEIIQSANRNQRLVITATEMLDSMIRNPRPTRAEASDVANAVFDGSDALMLSGETAIGSYPIQAVSTMQRIILDAESHQDQWGQPVNPPPPGERDQAVATTRAARKLAEDRGVAAVAVFTRTGRTARLMSKARPSAPIIGFTPESSTYTRMSAYWGVEPRMCELVTTVEAMTEIVESQLLGAERVLPGEEVVIVASLPLGQRGPPNSIYLHIVG